MRIVFMQRWASPHGSAEPGDELDLPDARARKLIEAKAARAVDDGRVRTRPAVPAANRARKGATNG